MALPCAPTARAESSRRRVALRWRAGALISAAECASAQARGPAPLLPRLRVRRLPARAARLRARAHRDSGCLRSPWPRRTVWLVVWKLVARGPHGLRGSPSEEQLHARRPPPHAPAPLAAPRRRRQGTPCGGGVMILCTNNACGVGGQSPHGGGGGGRSSHLQPEDQEAGPRTRTRWHRRPAGPCAALRGPAAAYGSVGLTGHFAVPMGLCKRGGQPSEGVSPGPFEAHPMAWPAKRRAQRAVCRALAPRFIQYGFIIGPAYFPRSKRGVRGCVPRGAGPMISSVGAARAPVK
jgi:hypothetical protein